MLVPGGTDSESVLAAFLVNLDVKPETKKQYGKALRLFFKWLEDNTVPFSGVARHDILAYRSYLQGGGKELSSQTVATYIVAIRRFYSWLESEKIYPNIAKDIKTPKVKSGFVKEHLTAEECRELLEKMYDDVDNKIRKKEYKNGRENGLRDYAIVNLILRTGLRTIEVSRLNVGDITTRRRKRVIMVWGKGRDSKDEYVPLSDKASAAIDEYLAVRGNARPADPLFICEGYGSLGRRMSARRIQAICKEALRGIGIDGHEFSAHSFRHTCAVLLIESGASAYDTQKYLRHASIDTTEIYLKSIEEELRLGRSPERMLDGCF